MAYLSKSDFKVALTCPAKLFFKKRKYPSANDDNEYLEFLADGGYMVETIAKLLHPEGIEVGFDRGVEAAFAATMEALKEQDVTLFEATLVIGNRMARVDILKKRGKLIDLIEVKAKSIDTSDGGDLFRGRRGVIRKPWLPYLEDVAFQTMICRELFPSHLVTPMLCLVDKSKTTGVDNIFSKFRLIPRDESQGNHYSRPTVEYADDPENLLKDHFLTFQPVDREVLDLMPEIKPAIEEFAASVREGISKLPAPLGVKCQKCEYRLGEPGDGFHECWGSLADVSPHILDYYQPGRIQSNGLPLVDILVRKGLANLADVAEGDLVTSKGEVGAIATRQRIQRQCTLANQEFINPDLGRILGQCAYPLHFIDFETSRIAVPYHSGMHPYQQVAFQWSCHTIPITGADPVHGDWINITDVYPNFAFARSLMDHLGAQGTIFTWSHHENSVLKDIEEQMGRYGCEDADLGRWLGRVVRHSPDDESPIVDLCRIAKDHYFHPKMKGRLSIKNVLPAVWEENAAIRSLPYFTKYVGRDETGTLLNPYKTLKPLPFGDPDSDEEETSEVIAEGGGAMRAYQEMLYGLSRDDAGKRDLWRKLLLQYCELDTAAMVMIWKHWVRSSCD